MPTITPTHDHGLSEARGRALPRPTRRGGSGRVALGAIVATGTAIAVLGLSAPPTGAQTIQDLKREIDTLQKRLEQLERAPAKAPVEGIRPGPEKGSFYVPGTDTAIKFGGFISADLQYDLTGDTGATFGASTIPLKNSTPGQPGAHNDHVRLTAQNSRFNFTSLTPTDFKTPVKGFLEFDLEGDTGSETFTNSHEPRLRHAFVEVPVNDNGKLLFGQTWSTMFTFGTSAPSLGFGGTSGGTFGRVPQIRYTHKVTPDITAIAAIENPELSLGNDPGKPTVSGSGVINPNDIAPDIDWRVDWNAPWGGPLQVGMLNHVLHIDRGGFEDTAWGWGFIANTAVPLPFDSTLYLQSTYGEGFGALLDPGFASGYLVNQVNPRLGCTSNTAVPNCEIDTSTQYAYKVGLGHQFTPALQANASFGYEQNDVPAGFTGDPTQHHWTAETNLIWVPIPDKVPGLQFGLQYTHGERVTASTTSHGEADRIHFQTLYNF